MNRRRREYPLLRTVVISAALTIIWACIALASIPSKPYTFSPSTLIQSSQVNADFDTLYSAFATVDNTNIGSAGIFASQIKPTSAAQATFGGALQYTFSNGLAVASGLAVTGGLNVTGGSVLNSITGPDCLSVDASHNLQTGAANCVHIVTTTGNGITVSNTGDTFQVGLVHNLSPVYNASGAEQSAHEVVGSFSCSVTISATGYYPCSTTVTFTGAAAFTGATTYACSDSQTSYSGGAGSYILQFLAGSSQATSGGNPGTTGVFPQNVSGSSAVVGWLIFTTSFTSSGTVSMTGAYTCRGT